jgi:hypothetical protein
LNKLLTKHQLEIISATAIQEYEKRNAKAEKEKRDRRLLNTKMLLENYRKLNRHCETVDEELEEYQDSIYDAEEFTLESLMKHKVKTARMMNHFKKVIKSYEFTAGNSEEDQRRLKLLKLRYIDSNFKVKDLRDTLHVEQGAIYNDTKVIIRDLSILLFGLDALEYKV